MEMFQFMVCAVSRLKKKSVAKFSPRGDYQHVGSFSPNGVKSLFNYRKFINCKSCISILARLIMMLFAVVGKNPPDRPGLDKVICHFDRWGRNDNMHYYNVLLCRQTNIDT